MRKLCKHGHSLAGANLRISAQGPRCRECQRISSLKSKKKTPIIRANKKFNNKRDGFKALVLATPAGRAFLVSTKRLARAHQNAAASNGIRASVIRATHTNYWVFIAGPLTRLFQVKRKK